MKLLHSFFDRDSSGHVTLLPEEPEDLWHLYNLVARGDVIKAATDGGSANILLLEGFGKLPNGSMQFKVDRHDGARWRRFRWATEAVLSQAPLAYANPSANPTLNPYPDPNPNSNPAPTLT